MGYGGALIWTGLLRNLRAHNPKAIIVLLHPFSLRRWIRRQPYQDKVIYHNNPDSNLVTNKWRWLYQKWRFRGKDVITVDMQNPAYQYWSRHGNRIEYKTGQHAIQIACNAHQINPAQLKPQLVLTPAEQRTAQEVLQKYNVRAQQYIVLEPHTKESFTPNKAWFWDRWEDLTSKLHNYIEYNQLPITLVQVGAGGKKILPHVTDVTGKVTFRETGYVLQQSLFLISCLGGLVHLNKAMGKRAVVLVSAFEPLELASYPDDSNLYTEMDCQCRGLTTPCPLGRESMRQISVDQVYKQCVALLEQEYPAIPTTKTVTKQEALVAKQSAGAQHL